MSESDLTMGVEEGFILVDPETGAVAPVADKVRERVGGPRHGQVVTELTKFQIETNSGVHTDLPGLREELVRLRAAVVTAAEGAGVGVAATGAALTGDEGRPPITPSPRYQRLRQEYGDVLRGQGVAACHVHLGIADREEAVQVINHLRPWLPVLQALTANSPISDGADTGHASWRTVAWSRWPSAGPPPFFRSGEHYDELVEGLRAFGAILDRGMVYWQVRLSHHQPTIEVRVADTGQTVAEVVLLAGLVRALGATALDDVRAGRPAPAVDQTLLGAASWRAARDGLEGENVDLLTGRRMSAWRLVDRLIDHAGPALRALDDLPLMDEGLDVLHRHGSGAARQRAAYRRRGLVGDVARMLVEQSRQDVPRLAG
ncbi:glutamate--cysteine ligase [Actinomadura sp. ATCC 31491]|uniref:Putative glutamate--cysteine ligase 2 n=1 Tax=Actinomadura luzonensis TaxID=2805427 RepID=A0ABT0FST4_9ACTN|nr:glutamate--cysteine ligase [Actinomadura luzonensis]MCK2215391.1 glutamate--cysteine ligase [Actinomadura luzonensis]